MPMDAKGKAEVAGRPFRIGPDYLLAVLMAWLVPGGGHWLMGHRLRGVVLGAILLGMFWWGEIGSGGYAVTRKEHPIFYYGQIGEGLSTILADKFVQFADVGGSGSDKMIDRNIPPLLSMGILLTSVSGLLNMLLILHVMDPRSWEARTVPASATGPAPGVKP